MRTKLLRQSAAGFTLIELIVVMVMVGVLFSIAAPGWLAFANRQRVNRVRDELLQELRRAQAVAAQTRRDQVFRINTAIDPPRVEVAAPDAPVGAQSRELGSGQIRPGTIQIQSTNNVQSITFDDRGNIVDDQGNVISSADIPENGIKFTVSLRSTPSVKSCAIVQTLLGATRSANGEQCD